MSSGKTGRVWPRHSRQTWSPAWGRFPARRLDTGKPGLDQIPATIPASEARIEIERRRARSPRQLADELAQHFGDDFNQFTYIPGMALIGRLRLGHQDEVARLAAPLADGSRDPLARPNSLAVAGHLVCAELAERTGSDVDLRALRKAADTGFTPDGAMRESMPYHGEMSDSRFMETAILVRTGRLTVERKYFDMAARHVDVSESTNKQSSLEAYLNRAAIVGPDPRGGGMALIFATELAGLR